MIKAKVVWFNNLKGFGEVETSVGNRLFFHWKSIQMDGFKKAFPNQEFYISSKDGETVYLARPV